MFSRGKRISGIKLRNTNEVGQNKLPYEIISSPTYYERFL
jgi:hypothetical protein